MKVDFSAALQFAPGQEDSMRALYRTPSVQCGALREGSRMNSHRRGESSSSFQQTAMSLLGDAALSSRAQHVTCNVAE